MSNACSIVFFLFRMSQLLVFFLWTQKIYFLNLTQRYVYGFEGERCRGEVRETWLRNINWATWPKQQKTLKGFHRITLNFAIHFSSYHRAEKCLPPNFPFKGKFWILFFHLKSYWIYIFKEKLIKSITRIFESRVICSHLPPHFPRKNRMS